MDTRGNEPLREMLAAEYALGTLRGGARRRFERWARSDPALQALAFAWSERLVPLIDAVPSIAPPQRVWHAIEARLPAFAARRAGPVAAAGWWDRIGIWRGLSAAFATVAIVAFALAFRPQPVVAPMIVKAPPEIVQAPPKIVEGPSKVIQAPTQVVEAPPKIVEGPTQVVEVEVAPAAVATLVDKASGKPVAVVLASRGGVLTVKVAADVAMAEGQGLQLWMAPNDSPTLVSLGMLPGQARSEPVRVEPAGVALDRAAAFGLSLEPAGGSPQPTKVLGLGALVRIAG